MYRLRDAGRELTESHRASGCGHRLVQARVKISGIRTERGMRAHYDGILRCGLIWICPVCSQQIRAQRAAEIQKAVQLHGIERVCMLTLTIRHASEHGLRQLVAALSAAYARMTKNNPWRKTRQAYGIMGTIRAVEVTLGESGWHPHLHVLLFVDVPLSDDGRRDLEHWLKDHWPHYVASLATSAMTPDFIYGACVTPCHKGSYLSKMHLEITAPRGKVAKGKNRTIWDVLNAWDVKEAPADRDLLVEHERAMRGVNAVRWSKGLKKRFGIGEQTDEEIVAGNVEEEVLLAMLGAVEWKAIRRIRGAPVRLLEAAERGGFVAVQALMTELRPSLKADPPGTPVTELWENPANELWTDVRRDGTAP